ncbi:MAG: OmpA family protein [Polyangiaceae bacterium]|nr:OmpA family protein [Polyangiaceae bacterium]
MTSLKETVVVNNPAGIGLDGLGLQAGPCDPRILPKLAAIAGEWIRVFRNIEFETDSAELLPESFAILDDVAAVLRQHQDVALIEIQGHTDRHASDLYNRQLSSARAETVRDDLTKRCGIAPHRLVVKGYGESRPLDRSATEQADAKNRRVSFKILRR